MLSTGGVNAVRKAGREAAPTKGREACDKTRRVGTK